MGERICPKCGYPINRRDEILKIIKKNPGISLGKIADLVGNIRVVSIWRWTNIFEKEGIIKVIRNGKGKKCQVYLK